MREDLDDVLDFIGAESLTDDEWEDTGVDEESTDSEIYQALLEVLISRESVSTVTDRLKNYYIAKGVAVNDPELAESNIFVGAKLCN